MQTETNSQDLKKK